ncbi:3-hydroxyisobutyrate dehydrogenase [Dokdonella fugitiva]|uniref:3-hydroxyisobutyrate dehydrogenase n=1 Tax=Dokdonella fugitiva TaxID=328517 RepID=A0A839EVZ2_9GAMM|nr:NAD(P)-dependent oxidoreductase [Dokdonella fugitiva]MBA8885952.1 3-hydroxyisobutyrate dehydrogenase [Dokdonella fugitiva]
MNVGFVGLGTMGLPMATNLLRAGCPLWLWNRTAERCAPLLGLGAHRAESIDALCRDAQTVLLMLFDEAALDAVLGRRTHAFGARVAGRTLVHLGTTSPAYSAALARDLEACGARYVEAPVSGSRVQAERGELIGMVSGSDDAVDAVLPLLAPLCRRTFRCGAVPGALRMKLAVNHYLIAMVTALAETVHAARSGGVDIALLRDVLDAGPMASEVSRIKLDKLVRAEFAPQAAVRDVATIADLVLAQADGAGADAPLIRACATLYRRAHDDGFGDLDMAGVIHAFR